MDTVIILIEVDKDRKVIINSLGIINYIIFARFNDAFYYIFNLSSNNSKITINKSSNDIAWVSIEIQDKITYYELRSVKPLNYESKIE